jgi:hypothetical protein
MAARALPRQVIAMLLRLDPPIPLQTPFGEAVAHIYSDGGLESECFWVCFCRNGAIMEFANSEVRACRNLTVGRDSPDRPATHRLLGAQKKPRGKRKNSGMPRAVIRTNGAAVHNGARHHNGVRHS